MPAILIGVGGLGGQIVYQAKRYIDDRLAGKPNDPVAQNPSHYFQYFLLDTREEDFHQQFSAGHKFVLPKHQTGIDNLVLGLFSSPQDPFFREFWPEDSNGAYLPGDFYQGAGQVRLKGKLAYRLHQTESSAPIVQAINQAVNQMMGANTPAAGTNQSRLDIYITGSLGGGTSSGISHALALHLRDVVPSYCRIFGFFLLADVAALVTEAVERTHVYANTWATLAEIDTFQMVPNRRPAGLMPYLHWLDPGAGISGSNRPFQIVYLFQHVNRNALTLNTSAECVRLVAECLSSEVFSPISGQVGGPGSQFLQQLTNNPELEERAATYASAGWATVTYPVQRLNLHLARRLTQRALDEFVLGATPAATAARADGIAAAEAYLGAQGLLWSGGNPLRTRLRFTVLADPVVGQMPKLDLSRTAKDDLKATVDRRRNLFDKWQREDFSPVLAKRADEIVATYRGASAPAAAMVGAPDSEDARLPTFVDFIEEQFQQAQALGYVRARGAVDSLVGLLGEQQILVKRHLYDPAYPAKSDKPGLIDRLKQHREKALSIAVKNMKDDFGLFGRNSASAKQHFTGHWWKRFTDDELDQATSKAAETIYAELLDEAKALQSTLSQMGDELHALSTSLEKDAKTDLGASYQGGVLEIGVLDDVQLADAQFADTVNAIHSHQGAGLAQSVISGTHGVQPELRRLRQIAAGDARAIRDQIKVWIKAVEADAIAYASGSVKGNVEALTVWEALRRECELRQQLTLIDVELQDALDAWRIHATARQQQGGIADGQAEFVVKRFIQNKLNAGVNKAAPFWQLDPMALAGYGPGNKLQRPFPLTVFALDPISLKKFESDTGITQIIDGILEGHGQTDDLESPHEVIFYRREGAVPLFFLDPTERQELWKAGQAERDYLGLFTDRRFAAILTGDLDRPDPPKVRIRYAVAAATYFKLLKVQPGAAAPSRITVNANGATTGQTFASLDDLEATLLADPAIERGLAQHVDMEWRTVSPPMRSITLDKMRRETEQRSLGAQDEDERKWWKAAAEAIRLREIHGRYNV